MISHFAIFNKYPMCVVRVLTAAGLEGIKNTVTPCYCFEISAQSTEDTDRLSGLLALCAPYGWEEQNCAAGRTRFLVCSEHLEYIRQVSKAVQENLPHLVCSMTETEGRDWISAWREYFTPVACGTRFVVVPPWLGKECFSGRTPIVIEPKSAFGTGHHASTVLCLRALSDLLDAGGVCRGQTFMDWGSGSGVLAIACAKSGLSGLALDIDQLAVDNALENIAINRVGNVAVVKGNLDYVVERGGRYDIILANILAGPLIEFAPCVVRLLAKDACLILSGMLEGQADRVEAAYLAEGLAAAKRLRDGEWTALVWD